MLSSRYKTLIQNTGLMFIGSFGSKIISFVMLPFYTMWLSVEDYGTCDIINVYATVLLAFVSLSIGEAIFVIPSQKSKEQQSSYFSSSLVFSICCILLLVVLYFVVTLFFNGLQGSFTKNIGYICLITSTTLYTTIFQQFCKGINKIKVFAFAGIVQTLVVASMGFVLIPHYKLDGYIWCILIANGLTMIYIFFSAKLYEYMNIHSYSTERLKEMFNYSIPLIPNSVIWLIVSYLNRPMMENYLGLYALGIYSLANRFPLLINTLYNNFSNSWQISILEQYGKEGFSRFYNNVILLAFCLMSLFVAVFSLFTRPLVQAFLNSSYFEAIIYIPVLCLSCLFISLGSMVGAIFSAVRKSKYFFYSSVWSALAAIVLNILMIKNFGLYGACWACVISYMIGGFSRVIYAKQFNTIMSVKYIISISLITTAIICAISYTSNSIIGSVLTLLLFLYIWIAMKRTELLPFLVNKIKNNGKNQ